MTHTSNGDAPNVNTETTRTRAFREIINYFVSKALKTAPPTTRLLILLGSAQKLRDQARAILLLSDQLFVEELYAVTRTMAEVAINAAYLQIAEEQEVERFQHFDTQMLYKQAMRIHHLVSTTLTAEEQSDVDATVAEARKKTERKDSDPSWSKRNLIGRAEFVDRQFPVKFIEVAITTYAYGHRSVHGTFTALSPYFGALDGEPIPDSVERTSDRALAMASGNFAMHAFAHFMNSFLGYGESQLIRRAGSLP